MDSASQQNQSASSRQIIGETLASLSLPKKILASVALASRSLSTSFQNWTNRFADKELYFYDLMKKAFALGLDPKIKPEEDKSRLSIRFGGGYLAGAVVNLRRAGSDLPVFSQVLLEREYEPLVKLIQKKVPSDHIEFIVDAGANIGLTTIYLKRFFPEAKIISIEPNAENFAMLAENVKANQLSSVNLLNAGLWQNEARLKIDQSFRDHLDWSVTLRENSESENEADGNVRGLPLLYIKQKYDFPAIDILKIDIEGGERFLFADDEAARQTLDGVRYLALEIHDEFEIRPKIEALLTKNGFSFFEVGETVFAYRN